MYATVGSMMWKMGMVVWLSKLGIIDSKKDNGIFNIQGREGGRG